MNISITRHNNGSYFYKLSTGRKVRNSKNVLVHERLTRRGFSTKKECHEHAERLMHEINLGVKTEDITFSEFWDIWFPQHCRKTTRGTPIALRTKESMIGYYTKHLEPYFGHMKLKDIIAGDLDNFCDAQLLQGLSPVTVGHQFKCASLVLKSARNRGYVFRNVAELTSPPRPPKKTAEERRLMVYSIEQQSLLRSKALMDLEDPTKFKFLRESRSDKFHRMQRWMFIELSLSIGTRISEACALKFSDIITTTNKVDGKFVHEVHIQRSLDRDGSYKNTKTNQDRRIPLHHDLFQQLMVYKAYLKKYAQQNWNGECDLVFPNSEGTFKPTRNLQENMSRFLKRIGLPGSSHTMRHTCVSNWLATTKDTLLTAELAGHSVEMTTKTYGHVLHENKAESVDLLYETMQRTNPLSQN